MKRKKSSILKKTSIMFTWKKMGQLFNPTTIGAHDWMQEQAQNPYVVVLDDVIRVYFNCRPRKDKDGKSTSFAGFVDLDRKDFSTIVGISSQPILPLGKKGEFDEFGVMAGAVTRIGEEYYLYYVGWTRMLSVPYNWSIGLAKSRDGGVTFSRYGRGPILGATNEEPYLQAGCSTILNIDGVYHLWYSSGIAWIETKQKPESVYQIMHASSTDGIHWNRDGRPIIAPVVDDESQASPTLINFNERWHLFFSYRYSVDFRNKDRGYRLGYAWSDDLSVWHRDDAMVGLGVSESGWDSEMICYPHVAEIDGRIYMFYCGNDFGKEGFGVAELLSK
jgi:predicted GH43/DUF377 family glycosyl hydrolase